MKKSTSLRNIKIVAPDSKPVEVASYQEGLEKLKAGDVAALTGDGMALRALMTKESGGMRIAGEGSSVEPYVIGLPRNDSDFRNRVDEFLTELWTSGAWLRIFHK